MNTQKTTIVSGNHYRIIPSKLPPINFFERFTPPELMEETFELEGLTNERLQEEVGKLTLVAAEDRISGPGASIVMAAFTHTGYPSRFTDGSYGVYYAARDLETAIRETIFHRERFLEATKEATCELDMRVYIGKLTKPMIDIRGDAFSNLTQPNMNSYTAAQAFGNTHKNSNSWGIIYPSARKAGGECLAILRPPATTIPTQSSHLSYHWNGDMIDGVYEKRSLVMNFNKNVRRIKPATPQLKEHEPS